MNLFNVVLPVLLTVLLIVSFFTWRKLINIGAIISLWWIGWLGISWYEYSYVYSPSLSTAMYIIAFTAISLIGIISGYTSKKITGKYNKNNNLYKYFEKVHLYIYPVVFIYVTFLIINFVNILSSNDLSAMRNIVGGSAYEGDAPPIFYSGIDFFLFRFFISPYIISFSFLSIVSFIYKNNKNILVKSIILNGMVSFAMFNRLYLYIFVIALGIAIVMYFSKINKDTLWSIEKVIISVFCVILAVSFLRAGDESVEKVLGRYIVGYHTINFALLDKEVNDTNSLLHKNKTWGIGMFGGIERLFSIYISKIYPDHEHIVWSNRDEHWDFKPVGKYDDGTIAYSNAHYNIVYTFLRDGGVLVLLIYSFLLGYIFGYIYKKSQAGGLVTVWLSIYVCVNVYILSLLKSRVESHEFWVPLIVLFCVTLAVKSNED